MGDGRVFVGIDLGWHGKPSGVAALRFAGAELELTALDRLDSHDLALRWVDAQASADDAVVGVDAPLVIRNATGTREAEKALNRDYRRFDAGCHAANLGLPFAARVTQFSRRLTTLGFVHEPVGPARRGGRFQLEVFPHAATIELFGLTRILKYKRGRRAERSLELARLRRLLRSRLAGGDPALRLPSLPSIPKTGNLKPVEDRLDAVLCAYAAAHWWLWGDSRNRVYGDNRDGGIVVPIRRA